MSNSKLPSSYKDPKIFNNKYIVKQQISSGSFGVVYLAFDKVTKEELAIKLEKEDDDVCTLEREVIILNRIDGVDGVPKLYWSGFEQDYNVMVLQLLGRDLAYQMKQYKKLSLKSVLQMAQQLVGVMQGVHEKGVVHRDLKPENILIGKDDINKIYLVDYGVSKIYIDHHKKHIPFRDKKSFIGTTRYASIAAHLGYEIGRKDDLESLFYVLIYFVKGRLPWQNLQNIGDRDRTEVVGEVKVKTEISELCKDLPSEISDILNYIRKLDFDSEPNYDLIQSYIRAAAIQSNVKLDHVFEWSPRLTAQGSLGSALQSNLNQQVVPTQQHQDHSPTSSKNIERIKDQQIWAVNDHRPSHSLLKPPDASMLQVPQRNGARQLTNSSAQSAQGSYSSMQIRYVPSQLENGSFLSGELPEKNFKKQLEPSPVQIQQVSSSPHIEEKKVMLKKKTMESTWGFRQEDIDEYPEDSPRLFDKYQQLQSVQKLKHNEPHRVHSTINVIK